MVLIDYNHARDILVKFEKGKPKQTSWYWFDKGIVYSPFDKIKFGIGFVGEGDYQVQENGKKTIQYVTWSSMMQRCYCKKHQERNHTYKGCTVAEEWHNFQNFAKWYDDNYYKVDEEIMNLDKDLLIKGNKVYSAETCIFVPSRINNLILKSDAARGNLPLGVYLEKRTNKFVAQIKRYSETRNIGTFNTPEEAFYAYKTTKENYIKEVAEEYKDKIPYKLYKSLLAYEVSIND